MKKIKTNQMVIKSVESILVIGYILFEELVWNIFAKPIYQYFKSLALLDSLKNYFLKANRYTLLGVFIVIFVLTEMMGVVSAYFFVNGDLFMATSVYISKIPIAAFTFWLFDLTKDQLLTFSWLKSSYNFILRQIEKVVNSSIYQGIKLRVKRVKTDLKKLYKSFFMEEGFIASIKSHYLVFKPQLINFFKRSKRAGNK